MLWQIPAGNAQEQWQRTDAYMRDVQQAFRSRPAIRLQGNDRYLKLLLVSHLFMRCKLQSVLCRDALDENFLHSTLNSNVQVSKIFFVMCILIRQGRD